ncbi:uncharacterized protein LOC135475562 [Liolophura sinensis]|uniref:uncharacterized protein LOC135475562 n=1 Tax=Liolophura sinensis TaxID=3198878 RepID=UPI003158F51D
MSRVGVEIVITLAVFVSLTATVVTGLRCYDCKDVNLDQVNFIVDKVFQTLIGNNPHCNKSVDESTPGVKIDNCPAPQFGKVAKCGYTKGRGSLSFLTFEFGASYYARECVEEDIGSPDTCQRNNNEDKSLFSEFLRTIGFNVLSYDGTRCTCSTNLCNGQLKVKASSLFWLSGMVLAVLGRQL